VEIFPSRFFTFGIKIAFAYVLDNHDARMALQFTKAVIPAQAGIQYIDHPWIPACAGMTANSITSPNHANPVYQNR
jgi:hypothetical protein